MGCGNDLVETSFEDTSCMDGRNCGLEWRHLSANDTVRAMLLATCVLLGDERRESNTSFNVVF